MKDFDDKLLGSLFSISIEFDNYDPCKSFQEAGKFISLNYQKSLDDQSTQRFSTELYRVGKEAFDYLGVTNKDHLDMRLQQSFFYILTVFLKGGYKVTGKKLGSENETLYFFLTTFKRTMHNLLRNKAMDESAKGKSELLDNLCTGIALSILSDIDEAFFYILLDDMESYNKLFFDIVNQRNLLNELTEHKKNSFYIRKQKATFAAQVRHQPMNKAKETLKEIWATGKYSSKDVCAEQESAGLGMSFSTARKALRNL